VVRRELGVGVPHVQHRLAAVADGPLRAGGVVVAERVGVGYRWLVGTGRQPPAVHLPLARVVAQLAGHVKPRKVPPQHWNRSVGTALDAGVVHLERGRPAARLDCPPLALARWRRRRNLTVRVLRFDGYPVQDLTARRSGGLEDGKPLALLLEEADDLLVGRRQRGILVRPAGVRSRVRISDHLRLLSIIFSVFISVSFANGWCT
jgi:hypothetical protein